MKSNTRNKILLVGILSVLLIPYVVLATYGWVYIGNVCSQPSNTMICPTSKCEIELWWSGLNIINWEITSGESVTMNFCSLGFDLKVYKWGVLTCDAKYLDNYRCYGNYVQQQYQSSSCLITWKSIQYCYYGCNLDTSTCKSRI